MAEETPINMIEEDKKRVVEGFVELLGDVVEDYIAEQGRMKKSGENRSKDFVRYLLGREEG